MPGTPIVRLFNVNFFAGSFSECVTLLQARLMDDKKKETLVVYTPNPEQIVLSKKNAEFLRTLQRADLLLPDGSGVVWASTLLHLRGKTARALPERIPGVDMVKHLVSFLEKSGQIGIVVGGREYDPIEQFPSHILWTPGYESIQFPRPEEEKNVLSMIEKVKPAVIFVAFGAPWQEKWIDEHLEFCAAHHVKVVMAVGGSFDFLMGKVQRAPQWMQKMGLEWLFRLVAQPWRWRRQLQLITFVKYVTQEMLS